MMAVMTELSKQIIMSVKTLPDRQKREVLRFIEYLRTTEDASFSDYVNQRTQQALEARKRGEHFTLLEELQQEYA
jgi:hypothetical protein